MHLSVADFITEGLGYAHLKSKTLIKLRHNLGLMLCPTPQMTTQTSVNKVLPGENA